MKDVYCFSKEEWYNYTKEVVDGIVYRVDLDKSYKKGMLEISHELTLFFIEKEGELTFYKGSEIASEDIDYSSQDYEYIKQRFPTVDQECHTLINEYKNEISNTSIKDEIISTVSNKLKDFIKDNIVPGINEVYANKTFKNRIEELQFFRNTIKQKANKYLNIFVESLWTSLKCMELKEVERNLIPTVDFSEECFETIYKIGECEYEGEDTYSFSVEATDKLLLLSNYFDTLDDIITYLCESEDYCETIISYNVNLDRFKIYFCWIDKSEEIFILKGNGVKDLKDLVMPFIENCKKDF